MAACLLAVFFTLFAFLRFTVCLAVEIFKYAWTVTFVSNQTKRCGWVCVGLLLFCAVKIRGALIFIDYNKMLIDFNGLDRKIFKKFKSAVDFYFKSAKIVMKNNRDGGGYLNAGIKRLNTEAFNDLSLLIKKIISL